MPVACADSLVSIIGCSCLLFEAVDFVAATILGESYNVDTDICCFPGRVPAFVAVVLVVPPPPLLSKDSHAVVPRQQEESETQSHAQQGDLFEYPIALPQDQVRSRRAAQCLSIGGVSSQNSFFRVNTLTPSGTTGMPLTKPTIPKPPRHRNVSPACLRFPAGLNGSVNVNSC